MVWQPLIDAKFSVYAEAINAVWFWKKLVLRGSTRDKKGGEQLAYFKGGFGKLADAMAEEVVKAGGEIRYNAPVTGVEAQARQIVSLATPQGAARGRQFLFTPAFPIIADMFEGVADPAWLQKLRRVKYLGNICLVLQLKKSLSETYWLNVNDPGFPFVGVIEHTNFDLPENYGGNRIVFISRYIAVEDPIWNYDDEKYLSMALEHLQRMFPDLDRSWIVDFHIWRAEYAQPVTERNYSAYVPGQDTPFDNVQIYTMAQIYPEDRGTNYAIREGRVAAESILKRL